MISDFNADYNSVKQLAEKYGAKYLEREMLCGYTSFKIGGECDILIEVNGTDLLCELIKLCRKEKIKYYIIGKGSNLLISDKGLRGVVIHLGNDFSDISVNGEYITCNAGASLVSVCRKALERELTGLEFAYGIPGSVGGALFMNAGAYGGEMKNIAYSCKYIDLDGNLREMEAEDMLLSYRHSVFFENGGCIAEVTLKLDKGDKDAISARMNELIAKRKEKQPLEYPSAGSTFKRPEGDYAARLIDLCGLKGYTVGGAMVSEKHSGFVINTGNATFSDVTKIIDDIRCTVRIEKGVTLVPEVQILI